MIICGAAVHRLFWKLRRLAALSHTNELGILSDIAERVALSGSFSHGISTGRK